MVATIRAFGVIPRSLARERLMTSTAAAPSFSGQEFPAVTCPSGRNAGRSWASPSSVVAGCGQSSSATRVPSGRTIDVISSSKNPDAVQLGNHFQDRLDDLGEEIVGSDGRHRALEGAPNRASGCGDDNWFTHWKGNEWHNRLHRPVSGSRFELAGISASGAASVASGTCYWQVFDAARHCPDYVALQDRVKR